MKERTEKHYVNLFITRDQKNENIQYKKAQQWVKINKIHRNTKFGFIEELRKSLLKYKYIYYHISNIS